MLQILVSCVCLLAVPGSDPPPGLNAEAEASQSESLARYNELKAKAPETAAGQWNLALWYEKNGLSAEALAHFASVVRLDPSREAAWKKLGMTKVRGRWLSGDDLAAEAARAKAEKLWAPRLRKIHKDVHVTRKQGEARKALDAIDQPDAVSSIYKEFGGGGAADQAIVVQTLGHIDSPLSSKLLAVLSIYGKTPVVRRQAAETLRRRDPDDFLDVLVAHMVDPLKYEVRPVRGPGSPGVLFVEGQRYNVRRVYAAPAPNVNPQPGDIITYDAAGAPVIERPNGLFASSRPFSAAKGGMPPLSLTTRSVTVISPLQVMAEAQRAAASSQAQLQADVDELDSLNEQRKRFTDLVIDTARAATDKDIGRNPDAWREAVGNRNLYQQTASRTPAKPTMSELVPPGYVPDFNGQFAFAQTVKVSQH